MKTKKTISLVIILLICLFFPTNGFAKKIEKKNEQKLYIDSYVKDFINSQRKIDNNINWNDRTKVFQVVSTYDLEGRLNGFIVNLTTDQKDSGFIKLEILPNNGNADITEFSYDGRYKIDGVDIKDYALSSKDKIISSGFLKYYVKCDDDILSMNKKKNLSHEIKEIKKRINAHYDLLEKQTSMKNSAISTSGKQIVYTNKYVKNLYEKKYEPVIMQEMSSGPVCAPTCGVSMLKYWNNCRGISRLYYDYSIKNTFLRLKKYMKTSEYGTYDDQACKGMCDYIKEEKRRKYLGKDYIEGFDWDWVKANIKNGNPFYMSALTKHYDGSDGKHAFLAVGYQICSNGNYIRVCDLWDKSFSHFFKTVFSNEIYALWYLRWQ